MTEELPLYAYREDGKVVGVSVEIIEALFQEANIPYTMEMYPWARAFEKVKNSFACVFPIQRSQENEVLFNWVSPVLISQTGFYKTVGKPLKVRAIRDAIPYKIGTYRGSFVEEYLEAQGFAVESTAKDEVNIQKLKVGRLDLWAADTLSAAYLSQKKGIKLEEVLVYFTSIRALACNSKVPLGVIERLQEALKTIYRDGVVDEILMKYKNNQ